MLKSKSGLFSFQLFDNSNRSINKRNGEEKLSEKVKFGESSKECDFIILGISEDIGPQMNGGFEGARIGYHSFLKAFQSVQSNNYCSGTNIGLLGEITQNVNFDSIEKNNGHVEELDNFVMMILSKFLSKEQKLIVIGGGHNNAFPLLKNLSQRSSKRINAINIDPHADCRSTEYRHSGNPFSSALNEKIIDNYTVFGLHESYNNSYTLNYLQDHSCQFNTFEQWLDNPGLWWNEFEEFGNTLTNEMSYSLDVDLDAISFSPSSALTPSGFSIEEIRKMIRNLSRKAEISVFHLPEGAPESEAEQRLYGKMITYFVMDFIKYQG